MAGEKQNAFSSFAIIHRAEESSLWLMYLDIEISQM
jgi:hypothetical protein